MLLQVSDAMINTQYAVPVHVTWQDMESSQEIPLGALHRIMAKDPSLGLSLLRGLQKWEPGRVAAGVWDTSKGYWPT